MMDLLRMLAMPPAQRAQLAVQADYERDMVALRCIIGAAIPKARLYEIVKELAAQSPHENHLMPAHLEYLLKNKWLIEGSPEEMRLDMALAYPPECEYRCLEKFLALIEAEGKK